MGGGGARAEDPIFQECGVAWDRGSRHRGTVGEGTKRALDTVTFICSDTVLTLYVQSQESRILGLFT